MDRCNKCNEIGEIIKPGLRCRKCVNEYKNRLANEKKNRKCAYCKLSYIPKGKDKECSVRCKIFNNIKIIGGCWEWQKKIGKHGYGQVTLNQKHCLIHRVSYEEFKSSIPKGKQVCHTCDNKKCVNPDHLWIGTAKENRQDAKIKGRLPDQRGRKHSEIAKKKMRNKKLGSKGFWTGKRRSKETIEKIKETKKRQRLKSLINNELQPFDTASH